MLILAIDPGSQKSSYVLWNGKQLVQYGTVENEHMLRLCSEPWDVHRAKVVIEWLSGYGLRVGQETFDTCRWVGRFEQAAGGAHLLTRKDIKRHLCDNTTAGDPHVRQALIAKLGAPGTRKTPGLTYGLAGGEWAALAVAVVWAELHP
jgi:hypothetical protein